MDISYAVKQLDREIDQDETRIVEKKKTRAALYGALSPQEKAVVDEEKKKLRPDPPAKQPA
jgi:hypothetical protein